MARQPDIEERISSRMASVVVQLMVETLSGQAKI